MTFTAVVAGALAIIGGIAGIISLANANKKNNSMDLSNKDSGSGTTSNNKTEGDNFFGTYIPPMVDVDTTGGNGGNKEPEKKEEQPPIAIAPEINQDENAIQDTTGANEETAINGVDFQSIFDQMKAFRDEQWAREDAIRKETQEREDNAYQRAVADLQKAGVNPNLFNFSASASGGGITQASGMDFSLYEKEMEKYMQILDQEFQENFKGDENSKDRFMEAIKSIISLVGIYAVFKKGSTKKTTGGKGG